MTQFRMEERPAWRWWVTPKPLLTKPIHNWFIFPHSFTSELVHALIEEWGLGPDDLILDPFAGAGTTILAAKEKGVPAQGYDISPLAELTARAKIANYNLPRLASTWNKIERGLDAGKWNGVSKDYPDLVKKALPGKLLSAFDNTARAIERLADSQAEKDFFRLALFSIVPTFSRAEATGGWLKWVDKRNGVRHFPEALAGQVERMLQNLQAVHQPRPVRGAHWKEGQADARHLPDKSETYSALITSPPYPNRHDYTRVFGVELMLGFLDWEATRKLRYQSFQSHPEAHPKRPSANGYTPPRTLQRSLTMIRKGKYDPRVTRMLEGYFLDLYLCLKESRRVCKRGARMAFVVGNAQYYGQQLRVDELTAEIGEQACLTCNKIVIARYRGNSAQQMGKYGRNPSRESVVYFQKL